MKEREGMEPRRSMRWPITLGIVLIGSILALGVGWVLVSIAAALGSQNAAFYWTVLGVGIALLVLVLVGVVVYLLLTIKAIALSQRQSNFIDSVTHELKSPLASLKLYLQTLTMRSVDVQQQADFHRFMLEDVERLDTLIDHLLDAAKTLHRKPSGSDEELSVQLLLTQSRDQVVMRYRIHPSSVKVIASASMVRGRQADLDIVFRNLIDNAVKYSMPSPQVLVEVCSEKFGMVCVRVIDNGPGIPVALRRKIFRRFVRIGNELERSTPGTGLGLFLVRSILRSLKGRITIHDRTDEQGTIFEVNLPGRYVAQKDSLSATPSASLN